MTFQNETELLLALAAIKNNTNGIAALTRHAVGLLRFTYDKRCSYFSQPKGIAWVICFHYIIVIIIIIILFCQGLVAPQAPYLMD